MEPETITNTPPTETKKASSRAFLVGIAVLLLAILGGGAYYFLHYRADAPDTAQTETKTLTAEEAAAPVGYVNGVVITRGELAKNVEQMTQASIQNGADPNDLALAAEIETQAFDILVNNELLRQAATKSVDAPTDEAVEAEIASLVEQNGGEEAFAALVAEAGFTEESLRATIKESLHIQAYLATKQTPVTVTDEQVVEFYDSLGGEEAGMPPLEEVREQIVEGIKQQEEQLQIQAVIDELRAEATIEKA